MKLLIKFLAALILSISAASAITVDGDPSEWNAASATFLSGDWKLNETWVPGPGIQFLVEDNRNPDFPKSIANPYTGVHIKGTGSNYAFFYESKVKFKDGSWVVEPYGDEAADLEAMYMQQDTDNVYLLIVTSMAPDAGGDLAPGDLRIDVDPTKSSGDGTPYELGMKLNTYYHVAGINQFDIAEVSTWTQNIGNYIPENAPTRIASGTFRERANGAYVNCPECNLNTGMDYDKPIYIIEMAIPKSALGGPDTYSFGAFSTVDACTNDLISIPIPEFAVIALPIAGILGLVFVLRTRRKEH